MPVTLRDLLDTPWSQMSSPLPPGTGLWAQGSAIPPFSFLCTLNCIEIRQLALWHFPAVKLKRTSLLGACLCTTGDASPCCSRYRSFQCTSGTYIPYPNRWAFMRPCGSAVIVICFIHKIYCPPQVPNRLTLFGNKKKRDRKRP